MAISFFCPSNPISSYSAPTEAANAPYSNLFNDEMALKWRSTSTTSTGFVVSQVGSVDTIALLFSNLRSTDQIRVRADNNAANLTGTPAYDSGNISPFAGTKVAPYTTKTIITLSNPVALTYWRFDFGVTGHPDNYIEASRLVLGTRYTTTQAMEWGPKYTLIDQSIRADGVGYVDFDRYPVVPSWTLAFSYIPMATWRNSFAPFLARVGSSVPVLLVPVPDDNTTWQAEAVYGYITRGLEGTCLYYDGWTIDLSIQGLAI